MKDLRKAARGRPCMMRLPGCDGGGDTTVLAHIRLGHFGMGSKPPDVCGVWACHNCHDVMDGRQSVSEYWQGQIEPMMLRGLIRTLTELSKEGLING